MSQPAIAVLLAAVLSVFATGAQARTAAPPPQHWVTSWGTAVQVPEPANELPTERWHDASLRQIVQVSLGGQELRVRLSNVFGSGPLTIDHATVALALASGRADIDPASLRALSFAGRASVTIPAGAAYYSDPVMLEHRAFADMAVSFHTAQAPQGQTGHPGSRSTSFYTGGDKVGEAAWPDAGKVAHWYQLADIEVLAPAAVGAVVALGDSITDGHGATTDGNDRWTDALAHRAAAAGTPLAVVNAGIGGGRMLRDGLGPNLAARFDRDTLARSGVTHAIVLIGVNDLGSQHRAGEDSPAARKAMVDALMDAHRQLVERAHAHGICVIGATIAPYVGSDYYHPDPTNEADRQALNSWIRGSKVFDAVADVDAAVRDPAHPERMLAALDGGDHLHPNPAGYRAIAAAIPLDALRHCALHR